VIDTDEHSRPESTAEKFANYVLFLFKMTAGVVTAANASSISDSAGAGIVASEHAVRERNLKPLARIVLYHCRYTRPCNRSYRLHQHQYRGHHIHKCRDFSC